MNPEAKTAHPAASVVLTLLALLGFVVAALFWLLTFFFFGNFRLSNPWHLFVLIYTTLYWPVPMTIPSL